jgi:hypothetical protein
VRPLVTLPAFVIFILCWFAGAYNWFMAIRNRVPGRPLWTFKGFGPDSFTELGLTYRTRFLKFWFVGLVSILVAILFGRG